MSNQHNNKYAIDMQNIVNKQADRIEQLEREKAELVKALEGMLRQFTKTPSTIRSKAARCNAHAALKLAGADVGNLSGATATDGGEG